jgi:hypothetical protein
MSQNDFKGRMQSCTSRRRVQWRRSVAYEELDALEARVATSEAQLAQVAQTHPVC